MVCAFKLNITSTYVLQLMCVLPLYHRLYQNRHIPVMISTKNKSVSLDSKLHSFDCVMFSAEFIKVCRDKGHPYATPSFKVQCKLVWKYNEGRRFVVSEHSGYWVTHCCSRETNLGWPQDRAIVCSVLVAALLAFFLRWHIHCQFWQFITTTYLLQLRILRCDCEGSLVWLHTHNFRQITEALRITACPSLLTYVPTRKPWMTLKQDSVYLRSEELAGGTQFFQLTGMLSN